MYDSIPVLHSKMEELPPRPELFDFHGVAMTRYFTDNWDQVQNFTARPDDILIATYPKAGMSMVVLYEACVTRLNMAVYRRFHLY